MTKELLFGIQTNGIRHTEADGLPDIDDRLRMVKEVGVHDYVDKTPAVHEIDDFVAASQKYCVLACPMECIYNSGYPPKNQGKGMNG